MRARILAVLLVTLGLCVNRAEEKRALKDNKDRISFALGAYIGEYWKSHGLEEDDVNWDLVMKGFRDKISGSPLLLGETEAKEAMRMLSSDLAARHQDKQKRLGEKNKREGEAFLARNKTKPGVQTRPSGLQYEVIAEGSGTSPTTNDLVVVNYRGTLIDGTEIINSAKSKSAQKPVPLSGTKGWMEALQLMKPGSKWQVVIPSELAHGERGSYPTIPPNATLIYDIELVCVDSTANKTEGPSPPGPPITSDIIKIPSAEELRKGADIEVIKSDQIERGKTTPK